MLIAKGLATALVAAQLAGAFGQQPARERERAAAAAAAAARPLAGRTVVIDPGHQLGNGRHPAQIGRLVDARGLRKPCNSTGTATNAGYPEATFTWEVGTRVRDRLRALGARVVLTRSTNSAAAWGPCVDARGKAANGADLLLSLHGDGSSPGAHGFHVIVSDRAGEPARLRARSTTYAEDTRAALQRAGFARSSYVGSGSALSFRSDLGTLNWAQPPAVMVELGNMRNSGDAAAMSSAGGRDRYARALVAAARTFLTR
ncbi:N-acetylmuramoyl-L-alanine amidase [Marmoricola endophyticus]|uniref:N-acetylmuramoyl-L-alanine amidase n=1 Tax=Marmoricola endophyticus TaxID=2040280 RepID=A0A917BEI2_9ACTN|nr:N-acetylmuramoyl-L-alanine amidase [Marmoricola endophyticus]GGF39513.1 N-acetylmuramoyl-L-alanine amidase [Marmoricola endophyticus]